MGDIACESRLNPFYNKSKGQSQTREGHYRLVSMYEDMSDMMVWPHILFNCAC